MPVTRHMATLATMISPRPGSDAPGCASGPAPHVPASGSTDDGSGSLTARQRQVLALLMHGRSNKSIARQLDVSEGTVKLHVAAILRALQVRNRTEAAIRAWRMGIGG